MSENHITILVLSKSKLKKKKKKKLIYISFIFTNIRKIVSEV